MHFAQVQHAWRPHSSPVLLCTKQVPAEHPCNMDLRSEGQQPNCKCCHTVVPHTTYQWMWHGHASKHTPRNQPEASPVLVQEQCTPKAVKTPSL